MLRGFDSRRVQVLAKPLERAREPHLARGLPRTTRSATSRKLRPSISLRTTTARCDSGSSARTGLAPGRKRLSAWAAASAKTSAATSSASAWFAERRRTNEYTCP
jgi:hypothetical protein